MFILPSFFFFLNLRTLRDGCGSAQEPAWKVGEGWNQHTGEIPTIGRNAPHPTWAHSPCVKDPCHLLCPFFLFFTPGEDSGVSFWRVCNGRRSWLPFTCRRCGAPFWPLCAHLLCYIPVLGLAHGDGSATFSSFLHRGRVLSAQQRRLRGRFDQPECEAQQAPRPHEHILTPRCKSRPLFRPRELGRDTSCAYLSLRQGTWNSKTGTFPRCPWRAKARCLQAPQAVLPVLLRKGQSHLSGKSRSFWRLEEETDAALCGSA